MTFKINGVIIIIISFISLQGVMCMDKHKENVNDSVSDTGVCTVPKSVLKYPQEVVDMGNYDQSLFHKVYREISEQLGIEAALTLHQMFKGTQVNFPVRFFDTKVVREMILKEYDGKNIKMLARKYDYSEKSVRRIINESIKKK